MHEFIKNEEFLQNLILLATKSGNAILEIYENFKQTLPDQKSQFVEYKKDQSPLTIADLKSNQILLDGLTKLTPNIPIVSEENESSWSFRKPNEIFWIIDPLDGTKEFINLSGEFTVNIGLVQNSRPVFGIIYAPVTQEFFWGGVFDGSYKLLDGKKIKLHVQNKTYTSSDSHSRRIHLDTQTIKIIASKSHLTHKTSDFIDKIKYSYELLQTGSSLKFCRIAEGKAHLYPRFGPTCEWDTAAGQAILEAAGGFVLTEDGQPLTYGKKETLNPNFIASSKNFNEFL